MSPSRKLRTFLTAASVCWLNASHAGLAGTAATPDTGSGRPGPAESSAQALEARTQYERGIVAYRRGDYQTAIAAFIAADLLIPSAALSYDVARSYESLEDVRNAVIWYRDYLHRSGFLPDRTRLEERVAALEAGLRSGGSGGPTRLAISSGPAVLDVALDGKRLGSTPWAGSLSPGPHELLLSSRGCLSSSSIPPGRRPR